jgi:hypothetical protein
MFVAVFVFAWAMLRMWGYQGSESPNKVRKSRRLHPEATSATKVADSLAANRKLFVASMAKKDPLEDALGVAHMQPVKSAVGRRKTRATGTVAVAIAVEKKQQREEENEEEEEDGVEHISARTRGGLVASPASGMKGAPSSSGAAAAQTAQPSAEKK